MFADWCAGWWQRRDARPKGKWTPKSAPGAQQTGQGQAEPPKPAQNATPTPKTALDPVSAPKKATDKHRLKALNNLGAAPGQANARLVENYLRSKLWIAIDQGVMDWPLEHVPATPEQMSRLSEEVIKFEIQQREQSTT